MPAATIQHQASILLFVTSATFVATFLAILKGLQWIWCRIVPLRELLRVRLPTLCLILLYLLVDHDYGAVVELSVVILAFVINLFSTGLFDGFAVVAAIHFSG